MWAKLAVIAVFAAMFLLPGWALLAINHQWRRWVGLQRWCVAFGLSAVFYPVLFYGTRFALPFFTWGPYKLGVLLIAFGIWSAWQMRGYWREQFAFDRLEWVAIGIFGATFFTRFWVIRNYPIPAWSDSFHHTLLTQLTAVQGRLPTSMEPYFSIPLGQYHLGLYALSATVQWLTQVQAHSALLWTAQFLNGACSLGVYLVLDRKVGRLGAVVGAAIVGLLSHQPAWYVNWGRFTQISSQAVLLIAWPVTWEAIVLWKQPWNQHKTSIMLHTVVAALLTGGVFLLHFRVAAFYLPLLAISVVWELGKARRDHRMRCTLVGIAVVGISALLVVWPAVWDAMRIYVAHRLSEPSALTPAEMSQTSQSYYEFPWATVPLLAAREWLLGLTGLSSIVVCLRRSKLAMAALLWIVMLWLLGNTYVLRMPLLDLTNLGAVLMMLYLPIGLVIGSAAEEVIKWGGNHRREKLIRATVALLFSAGFVASHMRVTEIEPYRFFVTPADMAAMTWIRDNTPLDARFAVNTTFWLPRAPHGTDAGYWIPYFTGRQTTAGAMLLSEAAPDYQDSIIRMSQAEERLEKDITALDELREIGISYVYIGAQGDFSGAGLNAARLTAAAGTTLAYQRNGVSIVKIK